jgi:hypothetical protein
VLNGPPRAPSLQGVKSTTSTPAVIGDTLLYTFSVANTGNVNISNVTVTDAKCAVAPVLVSEDIATNAILDVRETRTYSCTSKPITQADIDAAKVDNTATMTGDAADDSATPPGAIVTKTVDASTSTPIAQSASLTVVKSAGTPTVNLGIDAAVTDKDDKVIYTFTFHNTGNVTLNGLAVSDSKIASVSCPVVPLAPGDFADCTGTYVLTQTDLDAGSVTNTQSNTRSRQ